MKEIAMPTYLLIRKEKMDIAVGQEHDETACAALMELPRVLAKWILITSQGVPRVHNQSMRPAPTQSRSQYTLV
jgi:hypothetical protein